MAERGQPQEAPVALTLGLADCDRAVRDVALLEPEACAEAAEAAEVPKWKDVPKACGFKVETLQQRKQTLCHARRATPAASGLSLVRDVGAAGLLAQRG